MMRNTNFQHYAFTLLVITEYNIIQRYPKKCDGLAFAEVWGEMTNIIFRLKAVFYKEHQSSHGIVANIF